MMLWLRRTLVRFIFC